jgi:hypothetical protein
MAKPSTINTCSSSALVSINTTSIMTLASALVALTYKLSPNNRVTTSSDDTASIVASLCYNQLENMLSLAWNVMSLAYPQVCPTNGTLR